MMMMMISRPTMINDLPGFGDGEWAGQRGRGSGWVGQGVRRQSLGYAAGTVLLLPSSYDLT